MPPSSAPHTTPGLVLLTHTERLVDDLRRAGVRISVTEVLDAAAAFAHVDVADRAQLRTMLSTTLIKNVHHEALFGQLFDRHFPLRRSASGPHDSTVSPASSSNIGDRRLGDALDAAPDANSDIEPRSIVEAMVDRYAGIEEGARGERYHLQRTLRAADLEAVMAAAIKRSRVQVEGGDRATWRADLDARVDSARDLIAAEIRARLAALLPCDRPETGLGRLADPFDIELARASATELEMVRAAIRPLARRLAAQLSARRRSRQSGRVDIRRTIHRSLSTGGVPVEVLHRRPRAHRPELFALCDLSGSVADASSFTLTLISALAEEMSTTRTFAFVDAIDEVTDLLTSATGVIAPWQLLQSGRVIGPDGHSDYGAVLDSFWDRYARTGLTHRSTVVVVGDARGNHRPPGVDVLARIAARARHVYWLNPEPRARWNTTDSTQSAYAEHCTAVYEVRTLGQLSAAVQQMF